MDISENSFKADKRRANIKDGNTEYRLKKQELLRGHFVFSNILRNSVLFKTDYLKAYLKADIQKNKIINSVDFNQSPLLTNKVKVGFIIAKKKIRRSVLRNRIRRLMKESYRQNKLLFQGSHEFSIIFSLNDKGYDHIKEFPDEKFMFIETEMIRVAEKIKKYFSEK